MDTASQKSIKRKQFSHTVAQRTYQTPANPVLAQPADLQANPEEGENVKSKVIERIEKMTEEEVDRISKQLEQLTGEHLEQQKIAEEEQKEQDDHDLEAEEIQDKVSNLPEEAEYGQRSVTEVSEYGSRFRDVRSRSSKRSSKSYIDKLRKELESERMEREKLEGEIEKLKKLSSEISSKLGINIHKDK